MEADPDAGVLESEKVTIVFLVSRPDIIVAGDRIQNANGQVQCEQVSHHPPISAAYYYCPEKGIEAYCMDQIAAKVSGMCKWYLYGTDHL